MSLRSVGKKWGAPQTGDVEMVVVDPKVRERLGGELGEEAKVVRAVMVEAMNPLISTYQKTAESRRRKSDLSATLQEFYSQGYIFISRHGNNAGAPQPQFKVQMETKLSYTRPWLYRRQYGLFQ